jgi:hypothetical protein
MECDGSRPWIQDAASAVVMIIIVPIPSEQFYSVFCASLLWGSVLPILRTLPYFPFPCILCIPPILYPVYPIYALYLLYRLYPIYALYFLYRLYPVSHLFSVFSLPTVLPLSSAIFSTLVYSPCSVFPIFHIH